MIYVTPRNLCQHPAKFIVCGSHKPAFFVFPFPLSNHHASLCVTATALPGPSALARRSVDPFGLSMGAELRAPSRRVGWTRSPRARTNQHRPADGALSAFKSPGVCFGRDGCWRQGPRKGRRTIWNQQVRRWSQPLVILSVPLPPSLSLSLSLSRHQLWSPAVSCVGRFPSSEICCCCCCFPR